MGAGRLRQAEFRLENAALNNLPAHSSLPPVRHPPPEFQQAQARWLNKIGLLHRPWLILGSAPHPTLPKLLLDTHARVDINNAGRFAVDHGLPPAELTFRAKTRAWSEFPNLRTRGLIWFHSAPHFLMRLQLLLRLRVRVGSLMRVRRLERDATVETVAGVSPHASGGEVGKVTNGVAAVCYALFMGVPEVVIAGFSLSREGHSHDNRERPRRQVAEDAFVLGRIKHYPTLFTTEASFAAETGIKLWTHPENTTDLLKQ